jgi:hypothetical protein
MDPVILERMIVQYRLQCHMFDSYANRMGVEIGETDILVHAATMIGRKYVYGLTGKITVEKQVMIFESLYLIFDKD